jgi:hypothetical protein
LALQANGQKLLHRRSPGTAEGMHHSTLRSRLTTLLLVACGATL